MSIQGINIPNLVKSSPINLVASGSVSVSSSGNNIIVGANPILYSGNTLIQNSIIWMNFQYTNSSGQAIFYPTSDGTINGNALFTNIFSINLTPNSGTNSLTSIPLCSLKEVNFGNKEIVVNTVIGNTIAILGNLSLSSAGGGVPVYCEIKGN